MSLVLEQPGLSSIGPKGTNTSRWYVGGIRSIHSTVGTNNIVPSSGHLSVVALKYWYHAYSRRQRYPCVGCREQIKVTESKCACESATVAPAEIATVPEINSSETCSVGDRLVNCTTLSFKVLSFRILYRI